MNSIRLLTTVLAILALSELALAQYELTWHTIDSGGGMCFGSGSIELSGTIGQSDASSNANPMSGDGFELIGGFWAGPASAGTGVPAATLTAAVSRKANTAGPGGACDLPLLPGAATDPRLGGITEVRLTFNTTPGGPGANPVTVEQATCATPGYAPYSGASTLGASIAANTLVLTFTPGLETAKSYRITVGPGVTSLAGQFVEVRALIGDVNSDGRVNASDRSAVVGIWTGSNFSCETDLDGNGRTNAPDRSIVVASWTSGANCAP